MVRQGGVNTEICSQEARYMAQYRLFEITGYLKISGSLPLTLWRINLLLCRVVTLRQK